MLHAISVLEDQAQSLLFSLYNWVSAEDFKVQAIDHVLPPVATILRSQSLINNQLVMFWSSLKDIATSTQYAKGSFDPKSCINANYYNRIIEGLSAAGFRSMANLNLSQNIAKTYNDPSITLRSIPLPALNQKLAHLYKYKTLLTDEQAESTPLVISEIPAIPENEARNPPVTPQSIQRKPVLRRRRSSDIDLLSHHMSKTANSGCALQQFASPVTSAIAFAIVKGEGERIVLTGELKSSPTHHPHLEDENFTLNDKLHPDPSRRFDFMDICQLGAESPIGDDRIITSLLKHMSTSMKSHPKLKKYRPNQILYHVEESVHVEVEKKMTSYSLAEQILSFLVSNQSTDATFGQ